MPSAKNPVNPSIASQDAATARFVGRLLRQWPLIAVCAAIAAGGAYFTSNSRTPLYQSTTVVQLNSVDLGSVFLQTNLQQQGDNTDTKTATSAKIVTLPRVREVTSRALGGRVTTKQLASSISVAPEAGTTLVDISATNAQASLAAQIADATRDAFIEVRRQAAVSQLNSATVDIQSQLSALPMAQKHSQTAEDLRTRLQQIATLRAVSNGGVDTLQTARIPTKPISPQPKRDALLALFAGALLGVAFAVLRSRLDSTVRDPEELGEIWPRPLLGLIPQTRDLAGGQHTTPSATTAEAFALARTGLRYLHVGADIRSLLITSSTEGEGKSTVSWNLALAAATAGSKVLLVEADLRRPVLGARLGIVAQSGLSEVLAGIAPADEAVHHVALGGHSDVGVDVLLAGMVPPSPIALLERAETEMVLRRLASAYDLVIIDTPPATVVADAQVLLPYVDGVLVVSRLKLVRREAFTRLRDVLSDTGTPVLGFIVNGGAKARAYTYGSYTSARADSARPRIVSASAASKSE